jgi:DNA-binding NarL/FixJ family response regulator
LKILLADDHALIREGFERTLTVLDEEVAFVHARDRDSVVSQLAEHPNIDVILLDLVMPGANGFDLLSTLCDEYSHIPVVVISGTEDPRHIRRSIDYGASGFIPKSAEAEVMLAALELVLRGGVYVPADMLQSKVTEKTPAQRVIAEIQDAVERLTQRQREVLELMGHGMSNRDMACSLNVSEHTIKAHVAAILKGLQAANRTEAVVMARNSDLIDS